MIAGLNCSLRLAGTGNLVDLRGPADDFSANVSNPAQKRPGRSVMLNCLRGQGETLFGHSGARGTQQSPINRESARVNGTRQSSVPQSAPQAAGFHCWSVRENAGGTCTAGAGSTIAKDVSVLRLNHFPFQELLPGVWKAARWGTAARRCKASMRVGQGICGCR